QGRTLVATTIPYTYNDKTQRYEGKGTYTLSPNHRVQANFLKIVETEVNYTFNQRLDGPPQPWRSEGSRDALHVRIQRCLDPSIVRRGRIPRSEFQFRECRRKIDRPHRRHAVARPEPEQHAVLVRYVLRGLHARGSQ